MSKYYNQSVFLVNGNRITFRYQIIKPDIMGRKFKHEEMICRNGNLDVTIADGLTRAKLDNGMIAGNFIFDSENHFEKFCNNICIYENEDFPLRFSFSSDSNLKDESDSFLKKNENEFIAFSENFGYTFFMYFIPAENIYFMVQLEKEKFIRSSLTNNKSILEDVFSGFEYWS
ncbi:MAG: hypothetical protein ACJAWV_002125 [Flammeovirgaceae bacterium]|jgi:hypothetical protein